MQNESKVLLVVPLDLCYFDLMSPSDRISILLPFKNAAPWIEDCLRSIQHQSWTNWECHCIDDHSDDNSKSLVERFEACDARIKVCSNHGSGIVDALNTGLAEVSGEWITRMDADDLMPSNKLELLREALDNKKGRVATGKVRYFSEEPVSEGYRKYEAWLNERIDQQDHWDWIYRECVIASANWLTHRDHVFFEPGVYPEDYHHVFGWYESKLEVKSVDAVTHLWREHPHRRSRRSDDYQQEAFFQLKMSAFLRLDRKEESPLVILGSNVKTQLIIPFLKERGVPCVQLTQSDAHRLKSMEYPQILVGVYPSIQEQKKIVEYLGGLDLKMGRDWWWM